MSPSTRSKGKGKARATSSSPVPSPAPCSPIPGSASEVHSDAESDDASPAALEALLAQARLNMGRIAREKRRMRSGGADNEDEEDMLLLEVDEPTRGGAPLALDPGPSLPAPYIEMSETRADGLRRVRNLDAERLIAADDAAPAPAEPAYALARSGERLTKRAQRELRQTTTGANWFDLPAPPAADLPRLAREVDALRLRNALDPKRFYRKEEGEGRGVKGLPKYFAIGRVVETSTPFGTASADNLTRAERKRTLVDELVDNAEARHYAKRKFDALQETRAARGRGTLRRKQAARARKW